MSSALWPSARRRFRQQQARLEIGEPRRHHEIVGGKFEPQLARLLDEGEILVGERQDRDLREIDLLLARERQQQIERAFEALDIDDQRLLVGGEIGRKRSFRSSSAIMRSPSCRRIPARARATSNGAGARRRRRAPHRRAASPRRQAAAQASATSRLSSSVAVAMEHDIAAGRERRARALGKRARQGVHREVVAHQQAVESDATANHFAHHCDRSRGRRDRIDGAKHNMRGHPQRQLGERPEGREIGRLQRRAVGMRRPAAR